MYKQILSLILISGTLLLGACSAKPQVTTSTQTSALSHLPSWVLDPNVEGTIAAVGIAPKSKGGLQFQIPKAEADAQANIAAQISTEVSRLTKNSLREAQIEDVNDVENVFTQATKNLVKKIPISGARRINMYMDPNDRTLYIHMSLDSKMIATYFEQNRNYMKTMVENANLSRDRLNQAQAAVDSLYEELNKELEQMFKLLLGSFITVTLLSSCSTADLASSKRKDYLLKKELSTNAITNADKLQNDLNNELQIMMRKKGILLLSLLTLTTCTGTFVVTDNNYHKNDSIYLIPDDGITQNDNSKHIIQYLMTSS